MMTEFNSAAAAFAAKGKSVEDDMAEQLGEADADGPDEADEEYSEIEAEFRQGNHDEARLLAAQIVGDADDETVEAARDELAEVVGEVDYEAHPNTIAGHVSAMEDEAADGNQTTVARLAIQIVECINNGVDY